jgi:hypothetical protein
VLAVVDFNDHGPGGSWVGWVESAEARPVGSLRARPETDSLGMTTHDNGWDRVPVAGRGLDSPGSG